MNDLCNIKSKSEDKFENSLRPTKLIDYVGQKEIKETLNVYISTALKRKECLDHVLLFGPPGLGKTTLAYIIANEMGANLKLTSGPSINRPGDLASILADIEPGDILFIDEIHRLPKVVEEMLYSAMEDFVIDLVVSRDNNTQCIRLTLPPFTLIGATTRPGDLTAPLRDRFGIIESLHYYTKEELSFIIKRTAKLLDTQIDDKAVIELSKRCRGTPRIANRLFKRIRDFSEFKSASIIDGDTAAYALNKLNIDSAGLDIIDRKYLDCLINRFKGGPVGLDALSATISIEKVTLEDVNEPYLLQEGFVIRTPRGRVATKKAYLQLGIIGE